MSETNDYFGCTGGCSNVNILGLCLNTTFYKHETNIRATTFHFYQTTQRNMPADVEVLSH